MSQEQQGLLLDDTSGLECVDLGWNGGDLFCGNGCDHYDEQNCW